MARNLGRTSCQGCGHSEIKIDEYPRLLRPEEAGVYYEEFRSRYAFAKAHCPICQAKYLAWIEPRQEAIYDLSFQSTFNDEPGEADIPNYVEFDEVKNIVTHLSPTEVIIQDIKVVRLTPRAAA